MDLDHWRKIDVDDDDRRQAQQHETQRHKVATFIFQLLHSGSADASAVAAALHRQRQFVGPAKGGDKQRNQDRDQRLGPLGQAAWSSLIL